MTKTIISDEELNRRLTAYMDKHQLELEELIEKKVGVAVKAAINDAFKPVDSYRRSEAGWARQYVYNKVGNQVKKEIDHGAIKVDSDEIKNKITNSVQRKLRALDVDIRIND